MKIINTDFSNTRHGILSDIGLRGDGLETRVLELLNDSFHGGILWEPDIENCTMNQFGSGYPIFSGEIVKILGDFFCSESIGKNKNYFGVIQFDIYGVPTFVYDGELVYVATDPMDYYKFFDKEEVPRIPWVEQNSWQFDFEAPYKGCSKTLENMRNQQESYKQADGSYRLIDLLKYTPKEITLKVLPAFWEHMSPFEEVDFIWNSNYMRTAWKNYEKLNTHAKEQGWL